MARMVLVRGIFVCAARIAHLGVKHSMLGPYQIFKPPETSSRKYNFFIHFLFLSDQSCGTWTRTKILGFKGPCPTIRRSRSFGKEFSKDIASLPTFYQFFLLSSFSQCIKLLKVYQKPRPSNFRRPNITSVMSNDPFVYRKGGNTHIKSI